MAQRERRGVSLRLVASCSSSARLCATSSLRKDEAFCGCKLTSMTVCRDITSDSISAAKDHLHRSSARLTIVALRPSIVASCLSDKGAVRWDGRRATWSASAALESCLRHADPRRKDSQSETDALQGEGMHGSSLLLPRGVALYPDDPGCPVARLPSFVSIRFDLDRPEPDWDG